MEHIPVRVLLCNLKGVLVKYYFHFKLKDNQRTQFAGHGDRSDDGTKENASFDGVQDMAFDKDRNLLIADQMNNVIKKISIEKEAENSLKGKPKFKSKNFKKKKFYRKNKSKRPR